MNNNKKSYTVVLLEKKKRGLLDELTYFSSLQDTKEEALEEIRDNLIDVSSSIDVLESMEKLSFVGARTFLKWHTELDSES